VNDRLAQGRLQMTNVLTDDLPAPVAPMMLGKMQNEHVGMELKVNRSGTTHAM